MPTPPAHSGPVLLTDFTPLGPAPTVLRESPLTINGQFGAGWQGTVDYKIEARDLYAFCQFAGGNPYTVSLVPSGTAVRYIPLSHPDQPALLCTGIRSTAKGGFTASNSPTLRNWSHAAVSLSFTSVPFLTDGSTPFMVKETRAASEVYTLAGSKLSFPSDGKLIDADAGYTVPVIVYTVTIYLAYELNDAVLNPLLGCVNNATFLGLATGTVRFDGYNSVMTTLQGGQQAYTRTLLLSYRPVIWNQFLRPEGTWEAPTKPAGGNVYTAADLSPLIA